MTQHNSASVLASGDTVAWLDSLGVDERESFMIDRPGGGAMVITAARLGNVNIGIDQEGSVMIHTHDTADGAHECYVSKVEETRRTVATVNEIRAMAESDPRGALAQLAGLMGGVGMEVPTNGTPAPVSLPRLASDPPTGYYL